MVEPLFASLRRCCYACPSYYQVFLDFFPGISCDILKLANSTSRLEGLEHVSTVYEA